LIVFIGGRGLYSSYGGVENAIRNITNSLSVRGLSVGVYSSSSAIDQELRVDRRTANIVMHHPVVHCGGHSFFVLLCVLHTIFIARPSCVVLFASGPCIFVPLLRLAGIKVVASIRAIDSARDKWGIVARSVLKLGEYFAWRWADVLTVNSKSMVSYFQKWRSDVVFIPNGINLVDSESSENSIMDKYNLLDGQYLYFAARFDPVKRLHLLLHAFKEIDNKNIKLVVSGGNSKDSDYLSELLSYESDRVIFTGHVSSAEVQKLMVHCRGFILPSVLEGMSNSLLLAMALGKPVLAANVPENYDVLLDSRAVFRADDLEDLKSGLCRLIDDESFGFNLGQTLQRRAIDNYSWDNTALLFEKTFNS
jgi:glycosyltransferase involved in cell wall biosynthesis